MQLTERLNPPTSTPASVSTSASEAAWRWVVPGLSAGAVFLGFEMLAGAFSTSVWAFPQAIAQTIGLGAATYDFNASQLLVGVAIHLAFSVGLGALFLAIAHRLRLSGRRLVVAAVLFMWAESAISIWLVLHTLFPATLPLLLGAVPFWAPFTGRTGFGLILAYAITR